MGNAMNRMSRKISAQFLHESGLLGEINRTILHPFGMALAVNMNTDVDGELQEYDFHGILETDDSEGFLFEEETLKNIKRKINEFYKRNAKKLEKRSEETGYVVQPLDSLKLEDFAVPASLPPESIDLNREIAEFIKEQSVSLLDKKED